MLSLVLVLTVALDILLQFISVLQRKHSGSLPKSFAHRKRVSFVSFSVEMIGFFFVSLQRKRSGLFDFSFCIGSVVVLFV